MKIKLDGKFFRSWKEAARAHGIGYNTFISRVHNHGWDPARAATESLQQEPTYRYNDRMITTTEIAAVAGLSRNTVWRRLQRGMSVEEAMQPRMRRRGRLTDEDRR
jgi:predicted DNA-binding transcriptional regulator AlpA